MMDAEKNTDAVDILHRRYVEDNSEMEVLVKKERIRAKVAAELYQLRTQLGLSQRALAKKSGTSASVICKLENADYEGDSLAMLWRIAAALNKRVQVSLEPLQKTAN